MGKHWSQIGITKVKIPNMETAVVYKILTVSEVVQSLRGLLMCCCRKLAKSHLEILR
jgi:hypothetical protein